MQTWTYSNDSNSPVAKSFPAVFEYKGARTLEFSLESGELFFESVSVEAL